MQVTIYIALHCTIYHTAISQKQYQYCIVQTAWNDNWRGHESGKHAGGQNHPQEVIAMLTEAGWSFHRKN